MLKLLKNEFLSEKSHEILNEFAADGLRTLICTKKVIDKEEFLKWFDELKKIEIAGKGGEQKDNKVAEHIKLIERDLEYVGITVIL
jgi:hypothetical protein